jgi:hypothetical protein
LKPGQAQRADPGLWQGRVEEKIEKIMTRLQPVDFFFFLLKRYNFEFFQNRD